MSRGDEMEPKRDMGPSMFDVKSKFGGVVVYTDPVNRERTDSSDNVMSLLQEEQVFWWEFSKGSIAWAINTVKAEIDFLDVGTGSGVFSLLVARNTNAKNIRAIDKSARAIEVSKRNAHINDLNIDFRQEPYNEHTAARRSCKVIGFNPPYHLYPSEIEDKMPQHARGGTDGQGVFKEQLAIADHHLADGGIIAFNQMCLGRNGAPEFARYIPELVKETSLAYTNILPPMATGEFLRGVYGEAFREYQAETAGAFPELYYCNGIISRDNGGKVVVIKHTVPLQGRTWTDRIELHRQVALHRSK